MELCKGYGRCITVPFVVKQNKTITTTNQFPCICLCFTNWLVSFQKTQLTAFSQCATDGNRAFQEVLSPEVEVIEKPRYPQLCNDFDDKTMEKHKGIHLRFGMLGRLCNEAAMQGPTSCWHMAAKASGLKRAAIEDT